MFDLNDIWRVFRLPKSKQPSQWRHRDRRELARTANLQVEKGGRDKDGRPISRTWATKKALYNYAAWVDYEFHDAVFTAFDKLTEGNTEEALGHTS